LSRQIGWLSNVRIGSQSSSLNAEIAQPEMLRPAREDFVDRRLRGRHADEDHRRFGGWFVVHGSFNLKTAN
jgi:hypothetical protein